MMAGMIAHQARDQAPEPRPQADVDEAFHHDLAGQRPGQRRVLTRDRAAPPRTARSPASVPSSGVQQL